MFPSSSRPFAPQIPLSTSPTLSPWGNVVPYTCFCPGASEVSALLSASVYLRLPAPTRTPYLCPLGHISCMCFRGILVLWVPQERQALWVLQAHQENLVPMV